MDCNNNNYNEIIGANIRYERQKRDLTIEELSDILGIAPGFLGLIERGQRGTSIKNLCKIAHFFSLTLDQLITRYIDENKKAVQEDTSASDKKKLLLTSYINTSVEAEQDFFIASFKNLKKYNRKRFNNENNEEIEDIFEEDTENTVE